MCCGYGYFDPWSHVIATLKPGDVIKLKRGFGFPAKKMNQTLTVWQAHRFSAICTNGTLLSCTDGAGVELTDEVDLNPRPNLKAIGVFLRIKARNIIRDIEDKTEPIRRAVRNIRNKIKSVADDIWYAQYRFKRALKKMWEEL